jgi:hypothetical protein
MVVPPCIVDLPAGFAWQVNHPCLVPYDRLEFVPDPLLPDDVRKRLILEAIALGASHEASEQYEGVSRRDLQALAKELGVKGNGKTEEIIARIREARR